LSNIKYNLYGIDYKQQHEGLILRQHLMSKFDEATIKYWIPVM